MSYPTPWDPPAPAPDPPPDPKPWGTGPGPYGGTQPPATPASGTPANGGFTSQQNDAYQALLGMLQSWGLQDLAPVVKKLMVQGYNDATAIQYQLSQTDEYKKRFAANDIRIKNGLAPLDPKSYLMAEASYRQVMRESGLPAGFYDHPDDFTKFIGQDVSPQELQTRAKTATDFANSTDPNTRAALQQYYGIDSGHLAAYFLDTDRAMPLMQRQADAANFGAQALDQGLTTSRDRAEHFTDLGVTAGQARQGYSDIASILPTEQDIAQRFGQSYGQSDAEDEMFGGMASAARKRKKLNQSETNLFSGSGGAGNDFYHPDYALGRSTSGAF